MSPNRFSASCTAWLRMKALRLTPAKPAANSMRNASSSLALNEIHCSRFMGTFCVEGLVTPYTVVAPTEAGQLQSLAASANCLT